MNAHSSQSLAINESVPGMTLFDDVLDMHGHVLLPKGTVLTEKLIDGLKRHQISLVSVVAAVSDDGENEEDAFAAREARLARLFRHQTTGEEDATGVLEQYIRHYRQGEAE